jgi:hypothetical protein
MERKIITVLVLTVSVLLFVHIPFLSAGDFDRKEMVIALDMDGKFVWKSPNGDAWRRSSPGSRATPTYNDGVVYHMNPLGRLAAC